jgi:hypothetical protein
VTDVVGQQPACILGCRVFDAVDLHAANARSVSTLTR